MNARAGVIRRFLAGQTKRRDEPAVAGRVSLLMGKRRGFYSRQTDIGSATAIEHSAILLDHRQMAYLFPDATIEREKFAGLTKSLIAVKP